MRYHIRKMKLIVWSLAGNFETYHYKCHEFGFHSVKRKKKSVNQSININNHTKESAFDYFHETSKEVFVYSAIFDMQEDEIQSQQKSNLKFDGDVL